MVNIEKHLIEIETCKKEHLKRDNSYTVAVLEQAHEVAKELQKYRDAEEQGLLFRLPCKVGDTVWYEDKNSTWLIGVHQYQITNVMISQNKKGEWTKKYRAMRIYNGKTVDWQINFSFDDIGKTVFLTKEEAEQKLAEIRGDNNV